MHDWWFSHRISYSNEWGSVWDHSRWFSIRAFVIEHLSVRFHISDNEGEYVVHLKRESRCLRLILWEKQTFAIIIFQIGFSIEIAKYTTSCLNLIERRHVIKWREEECSLFQRIERINWKDYLRLVRFQCCRNQSKRCHYWQITQHCWVKNSRIYG